MLRAMTTASLLVALGLSCAHTPAPASPPPPADLKSPFVGFSSAHYSDPKSWLCLPGRAGDPCQQDMASAVWLPDGGWSAEPSPAAETTHAVDCFYVYPTVDMSWGPANHVDFSDTQRISETAVAQVGHFREVCNLYAPLYRQITIGTYFRSVEKREEYLSVAASDVYDAFLHYMGQYNHGHKIVLLGHSQGAEMVTRLLKRFFDDDPVMREKLVLAMPLGGALDVARGAKTGGTFKNLPMCSQPGEVGCVIAYRSIIAGAKIPDSELPAGHEGMCVNPATLDDPGPLPFHRVPFRRAYLLTNERLKKHVHLPKHDDAPFAELPDYYRGECVDGKGGERFLAVTAPAVPGDPRTNPIDFGSMFLRGNFGLHILDYQFEQGDLIDLVGRRANP